MELWDVYDINRKYTGKVIDRHSNERLKKGEYHLVVQAIIINSKGEILLNKRSKLKNKYPNMFRILFYLFQFLILKKSSYKIKKK